MSRDILSSLLLSTNGPNKLAIIDVRDSGKIFSFMWACSCWLHTHITLSLKYICVRSDHVGGHIRSSTWVPTSTLDHRLPELVRTLKDKEKVVFHCALSQQRGPSAALRYARERERMLGPEESKKQEVFVLDGGFLQWQKKYGKDPRLTEGYVEDIWQDY